MIRSFSVAAFLFAALCTATGLAAPPSTDALIEQGLDLRRDGKPERALELFRRAHAIAPSPRTFGQIGLVEVSLKRWVDGETHLSVSLSNPDDSWVIKNRAFLDEALAQCRQHVGDLIVSGPAGVEVLVGGRLAGTLPAVPTLRLAEGTVSVSASSSGFRPFEKTVTVRPGVRTPLAIVLTPVGPAPLAAPSVATMVSASAPSVTRAPQHTDGRGWHTWAGVSLAAVGAAAIGWGVTWIVVDGGDACGTTTGASCKSVYNTRTPGWILTGVGAAAVAGGAAILLTGHQTSGPNVSVGLTPGSILLQGRF